MNWIREYAIPTLIVSIASILVCGGLWFIYTSSNNNSVEENVSSPVSSETSEVDEEREMAAGNLGIILPIILFVASGLKVAVLMGVPGLITNRVLRRMQVSSYEQTSVAST